MLIGNPQLCIRTFHFSPLLLQVVFLNTLALGSRSKLHISAMASKPSISYTPQDHSHVLSLVKSLENSTEKHGGGKKAVSCKKHSYEVANSGGIKVDSWQFRDWDYKRSDLPTYARGLFTYRRKDGAYEIAARGYDKFFNVGEVPETQWDNVAAKTHGPYELSVKENGCIIFISGLEGDHLLVCSKHSTGARDNASLSHASAGERWVDKHLRAIGKTRQDLAQELRRRNVTAVAELCDDAFEEHVLAYEPKDAGLYLHGMNLNLPEFSTYPGKLVHEFADKWGFKKAQYLLKVDIDSMKIFLDECAETGSYNGRDTEGFVIRCRKKGHDATGGFQDWFFKFKFEEPYLMYRQWRECTKAIISGRPPKYKKHKKITEEYLLYARRQLAKNPSLEKAYNMNHGIIAMRDGFLQERGLRGHDIIRQEEEGEDGDKAAVTKNLVLVPVASIGCGKTTIAIALAKLFGWGHVQNDNITTKSNRPKQFAAQVSSALIVHPAVIADRNNHQKRERQQIIDDVLAINPETHFVALQYVHDPKSELLPAIRSITQKRIFTRGDNHQTIQAGSKSRSDIIDIMEGFLKRFEPVNSHSEPDDAFDEIINLDVTASSHKNLETVVSALHLSYPKLVRTMPSQQDLDKAVNAALNDYKPDIKHDLSFRSNKNEKDTKRNGSVRQTNSPAQAKAPKLEYFSIKLPTSLVVSTLAKVFNHVPPEQAKMYRQLQQSRLVQSAFHVTLIHRASIDKHPELWNYLASLHAETLTKDASNPSAGSAGPSIGKCRVLLERIVWDERVMCIVARLLDEGWDTANAVAHITVGTASQDIKPKESNDLLQKWMVNGAERGIRECEIDGHVTAHGNVVAVMSNR